ncbi:hypothetical protein BKA93DRAFT_790958 [Sparassis latifolia]|uniref:Protein-S-isoprenylcysteine O-methyltransferase n=1 Tax=Sparassis crispa TaxID=139825 RepID=A0A401GRP1_9APHY|nr:hypothetical protein SCP_0700920 [Sparassis crispa]GBE84911.1 hypothetical protein SCP_0700920 [Sparassis crispa]
MSAIRWIRSRRRSTTTPANMAPFPDILFTSSNDTYATLAGHPGTTHIRWIDLLVWLSTLLVPLLIIQRGMRRSLQLNKSLPVKPSKLTPLEKALMPIHTVSFFMPTLVYLVGSLQACLHQPQWAWWSECALPDDPRADTLRLAACGLSVVCAWCLNSAFTHLGTQVHHIGVREKPKTVETGPFSVVRHPMYSAVIVQQFLHIIMFWSLFPLAAAFITAGAMVMKISPEERLRELDPEAGPDYVAYKRKVPSKLIPYIW